MEVEEEEDSDKKIEMDSEKKEADSEEEAEEDLDREEEEIETVKASKTPEEVNRIGKFIIVIFRFRKGGRRDGKPSVDKLDDMLDGYWQKSGNDNQKESMKKMNDEILMNNLDNYWKQKDQPKTNDKEEEKE